MKEEEKNKNKVNKINNSENQKNTDDDDKNQNSTINEPNASEDEDNETLDNEEIESKENELQEQVEQLRDEKLRLLAEMDNLRKRSERDRSDSIKYGSINFARDILSPEDNLTRALEAIPQEEKNSETVKNLIDGLKMVQKEFSSILERHGVKKIIALNKKFDHNFHQAMIEVENDEVEEGIVVQELQFGYTMHDRLLRPSMVGVSKKPFKDKDDEKKD